MTQHEEQRRLTRALAAHDVDCGDVGAPLALKQCGQAGTLGHPSLRGLASARPLAPPASDPHSAGPAADPLRQDQRPPVARGQARGHRGSPCFAVECRRDRERDVRTLIAGETRPGIHLTQVFELAKDDPQTRRPVKLDELERLACTGGRRRSRDAARFGAMELPAWR